MICPRCRLDLEPEAFPVDRRRPHGQGTPCRDCQGASLKAWKRAVGYNRLRRQARAIRRAS